MGKRGKRLAAVSLICALALSGCGGRKEEEACPYEDFIVVDVFDCLANYQGIQSGWFAKIVKDKFNMELNIIAPNVAGGGDTLFETRSAAGNLGDILIVSGQNDILQDMVTSGLVLDMEPYLRDKDIMRFDIAIESLNGGISPEGIYAIPSEVSENAPTVPGESLEPVYGPYIRWDLYKQMGYPRMETLEDILPVLKRMQELEPVAENGEKTYGFSFFKDWDANLMNAAKQPCCFYGYDENGFVLVKYDSSDYQDILDENSLYIRMLKLYFDANQLGLVDPESPTQNYETLIEKYENGQLLYSPWPWVAQTYYNTISRKRQGKGFMMADIEDMKIYSYGCSREGNHKVIIGVGSKAQDPERMAAFIDWLYSPEGISANGVTSMADTAGPKGLSWEYGDNGPYLTEFGVNAMLEGNAQMPQEWGQGTWRDGISELNYMPVGRSELDEKGYPYYYLQWDSVLMMEETELDRVWREHMKASTTMEYLTLNHKLAVAPGCGYTALPETPEEAALRKQCRAVIQKYSWDMVFAENEDAFYELFGRMRTEAESLGYEKILAFDMESSVIKEKARWAAVAEYDESRKK